MLRLTQLILFTPDVVRLRGFYEEQVGLEPLSAEPHWVQLGTAGATLALHLVPPGKAVGIKPVFESDDLVRDVAAMRGRGAIFADEIQEPGWGRLIHIDDPEGNRLGLFQPHAPTPLGRGLRLTTVIVNARQLATTRSFYRDVLGLALTTDSPWWVEFAAGGAALALHPRSDGVEQHHAQPVSFGLAVPGLADWHQEALARDLVFTAPPTDRGFGTFADAVDPDGNQVTFRDVPEPQTLEEQLAEPFEDDAAPRRAAIRKPVRKGVAAVSRVAIKPGHRPAKSAAKSTRRGKPISRVASPRGTGPAGARKKPKRKHDPKRARTKPAIGRLRKAERRSLLSQKRAAAAAGKRKPVKRASRARPAKRPAVPARGRR